METLKTFQDNHVTTDLLELADLESMNPSVLDILLEAAYLLGCTGQYAKSEACFRGILALDNRCVGGWLGLGNVLLMQGQTEASESAYEMVLQNDPNDPAARAFLGELYLCTGRIEQGREMLESVYWDYPESMAGNWAWKLAQLSRTVA